MEEISGQEELLSPDVQEEPQPSWEEERAELNGRLASLTAELNDRRVKEAFYRKATEAGVANPDALAKIVNLGNVTFDDEGNAQGIDDILSAFTVAVKPKIIGDGPGGPGEQHDNTSTQLLAQAAAKARTSGRAEDVAAYSALKHKLGQQK